MMYIRNVIIPASIEEKIWIKHHVTEKEADEFFANLPRILFHEKGMSVEGEDLYASQGQTFAGRYLTIFFIYKLSKDALLVTARDMNKSERKNYAKSKRR